MKRAVSFILFLFFLEGVQAQIVDFDYTPQNSCDTALITFTDKSLISDTSKFTFQWSFGNGEVYNGDKYFKRNPPAQSYTHSGDYTVSYYIGSIVKTKIIHVSKSPNPYFEVFDTPDTMTYQFKKADGYDLPDSCYHWSINDTIIGSITGKQYVHTFPKVGVYQVSLTVIDSSQAKCTSTYTRTVRVFGKLIIPQYTYFTPNDEANKTFNIITNGTNLYRLTIFSRTGLVVFKSESTKITWDGYLSSGELAKAGTYFYYVEQLSTQNTPQYGCLLLMY